MALGDWTSSYEATPDASESAGLGDDRMRTDRSETRIRGAVIQDFGGPTIDAAYGDTGKINPGTARIYRATGALPTTYLKPDASVQSISLAAADTGHVVLDQNGWCDVLHMWDGSLSTPGWVGLPGAPNLALNGGMRFDQRMAGTAKTLAAATRTRVLDGWAGTVTGSAAATIQQVTSGLPTGAVSKYGLKVVGAASVSNVDIDTRFEARDCSQWGGYVTVRFGMVYVDGAAGTVTPTLRVDTCNAADNFGAVTNRVSQALTATADAYQTHTFDLSALTNYANGVQFVIRFSGASDLNANTKSVVITDFSITPGRARPRRFVQPPYEVEYERCLRYYQKSFAYGTVPATNWLGAGSGVAADCIVIGGSSAGSSTDIAAGMWVHNPPMVAAPTITIFNPRAASNNGMQIDGAGAVTVNSAAGTKVSQFGADPSGLGESDRAIQFGATFEAGL